MKLKFRSISYSQGGEDLVLAKLLGNKPKGFFIDVGANDPILLSNTYLFYKMGWRGLNFEPIPELASKIKIKRPEDIVINMAMSNFVGTTDFYAGKDEFNVNSSLNNSDLPRKSIIKVKVDKLENILDELKIQEIDFISIDTEGTELDVLEGLNLDKYRPKFILAEYNTSSIGNDKLSPYLINRGYQPVFINTWNIIFSENFSKDSIKCYEPKKYSVKNILIYLMQSIKR